MDPSYQQAMIQALMGGAPGMTGQNPSTAYGQSFLTGNGTAPMPTAGQPAGNTAYAGMLGTPAPSQQLQQPFAAYPSMGG